MSLSCADEAPVWRPFQFALLDDVVMSVDTDHRYQFCKLLKAHFPDTQFIITTHDRVWAEQMKSAGLVTAKTSLMFHGWSIEAGPIVKSSKDVWDKISGELGKGNVGDAAGFFAAISNMRRDT